MLNRKIFISLTIITNILFILFIITNPITNISIITQSLAIITINILFTFFSLVTYSLFGIFILTPIQGFFLFNMKKVHHSDFGYLYTLKIKNYVFVFQQKKIYLELVDYFSYINVENFKLKLENIFDYKIETNKDIEDYKKWNGFTKSKKSNKK